MFPSIMRDNTHNTHDTHKYRLTNARGSVVLEPSMAYIIAEPCIGTCDTSCVEVCPVDCIHPAEGHDDPADKQLYIDPDECIDCAACVPECPVDAIFEESELPEKWAHFIEINANYFK